MRLLLKLFCSAFLSVVLFSCEKEYSLEGTTGSAVFTIGGAPGICTGAVIAGSYNAGFPLDAGNTVTIDVDVTVIGTYSITTVTDNGMVFSGAGAFTTVGQQTIVLTGSGIPVITGTSTFTTGGNGCTFTITVIGTPGTGAVYTFGGAPATCTGFTLAGIYTAGELLTAGNTVSVNLDVTTTGTYTISTNQVNGISFSASGSFNNQGATTVVLTAIGTPLVDGTFDFTLNGNGCTFSLTVVAAASVDFIRCSIDGVARTFNVDPLGFTPDPTTFLLAGTETAATNSPALEINLVKSPAVSVGTYDRPTITNLDTYCVVSFNDGVNTEAWVPGILSQPNGFTVIVTSIAGNRIAGTFSGTLYDNNGQGNTPKTITSGEFNVAYQ